MVGAAESQPGFDVADDVVILNSGRVPVVTARLKGGTVDLRQHLGIF